METKKTNQEVAQEVLDGKWGNGAERRRLLQAYGYDYEVVQGIVNVLVQDREQNPKLNTLEVDVDLSKYGSIKLNFGGIK